MLKDKNLTYSFLSEDLRKEHDRTARRAFTNGLSNSKIGNIMTIRGSNSLEDAFTHALQVENDEVHKINGNELICRFCKRIGHRESDCRGKNKDDNGISSLVTALRAIACPSINTRQNLYQNTNWNRNSNRNRYSPTNRNYNNYNNNNNYNRNGGMNNYNNGNRNQSMNRQYNNGIIVTMVEYNKIEIIMNEITIKTETIFRTIVIKIMIIDIIITVKIETVNKTIVNIIIDRIILQAFFIKAKM